LPEVNRVQTEDDGERGLAAARDVARVLKGGGVAALATVVESPRDETRVGAKLLVEETGRRAGTTGDADFDEAVASQAAAFLASRAEARTDAAREFAPGAEAWAGARVLFERIEPEPRVVVCGAGHVGAALARLASAVGCRVTLIDDRADFVSRARFPEENVELVTAEGWAGPVRAAIGTGRGVSVAVVTRGHNEDEECLRAVLAARPDYVGMIGSRRRTNIVLARLRESGFGEEVLREVRAPVGLDIGAVTPEEVALSILAEIVAHRRGGTGASLSAWRRG
jgi:xanthine dehydrogenase accessory factor